MDTQQEMIEEIKVSAVARRLKALRERTRLSLKACGKLIGKSASGYAHYEDRHKEEYQPLDVILKLVPAFTARGVDEEELLNLCDPLLTGRVIRSKNVVWARLVTSLPAGGFMEALERPSEGPPIPVDWHRPTVVLMRVQGDSMNRVMPDGALVAVDYADTDLIDGKVYVFRLYGEITMKRYRAEPQRLEPDSIGAHETIFPKDGLEVLGRVFKVLTDL